MSTSKTDMRKVGITSVEGYTGRYITKAFNKWYKNVDIVAFSKSPDKVKDLSVRAFPWDTADKMCKNLEGVDSFVIVPPSGQDKVDVTRRYLEACKKAGIKHVVVIGTTLPQDYNRFENDNKFKRLQEFRNIERLVSECGMQNVCIVRLAFYMENFLLYSKQMKKDKVLPLPLGQQDRMAPVSLEDAAKGIVELCNKGKDHKSNQVYNFTGCESWTPQEMADKASRSLDCEIKFKQISESDAKTILSKTGLDECERELLLEMYEATRNGWFKETSDDLCKFVSKEQATKLGDFFRNYKSEFCA